MLLGLLSLRRIKQKAAMIRKINFNSCCTHPCKTGSISARFIMEFGGGNGAGLTCLGVQRPSPRTVMGGRRYSS